MIKTVYAVVMFCITTAFASAQSLTGENLQGTWRICGFNAAGVTYDMVTQNLTFAPDYPKQLDDEAKEGLKEGFSQMMEQYNNSFLAINKDTFSCSFGSVSGEGTCKVNVKDGTPYLELAYKGGAVETSKISLADNRLRLYYGSGSTEGYIILSRG